MSKRSYAASCTALGLMLLALLVGLSVSGCGSTSETGSQSTLPVVATEETSFTTTTTELLASTTVSTIASTTTTAATTTTTEPTTTTEATATTLQGGSLQIVTVRYDAPGNDNNNLNEEYIVFKVLVSTSLLGYAVEDLANHRYDFPDRTFEKDQTFTLHTGKGTDTQTDLYWGASGSAIWNNDTDTVKVLDPQGQIVTSYTY